MKNKNIDYGTKDVFTKEDFEDKNVKVRITTFIDMDILKALKKEAKEAGIGYQTLLNKKLRESVLDEVHISIEDVSKRVEMLEKLMKSKIKVEG